MFLKNKNIIFKIRRSKVPDYAALKLELKGLVKPETASSTRSTLHLSRLDISFRCTEELFQHIEL